MKSDSQIQQDVLRELKWDHRVKETEIGVEVDSGIVTLTGDVSSYAKKMAAVEAAHRVSGVLDVANEIEVVVPGSLTITDTDIATAVRNELKWNVFIPDGHIHSTVSRGWVTLEGAVEMLGQRAEVERAVRDIEGVRGVTNDITVTRQKIDATSLRVAIEHALERRAERQAQHGADRIGVAVDDHTVTLTGRVHSWREKQAVVGTVIQAAGIDAVVDHIRIEPTIM